MNEGRSNPESKRSAPTERHGQATAAGFGPVTRAAMPDDFVARVELFRHGTVEGFERRLVRGQADVPPSARGRAEHASLCRFVRARAWRPTRVFSSDLARCRELGEALARDAGVPLELVPALREQHMGEWQGQAWDAISARHGKAINDYWDDYWNAVPPGGESMAAMAARALDWWRAMLPELRDERAFVVTHAGVIRALLCAELGVSPNDALRFAPPVASCTSLSLSAAGAVLEGLGLRAEEAAQASSTDEPRASSTEPARASTAETPRESTGGMPPRIGLSGSAGTGKSTLGRALAEHLGVPFIEERMRLRLEAGLQLHRLTHDELRALVLELWDEQRALEERHASGFVADRTSLDYAAFWLHYAFHDREEETRRFFERMIDWSARYTRVLLFPHGVIPLETDGVRAPNPWQQLRFQLLVEGLLERHVAPRALERVPATSEFDARLRWAVERLTRSSY